MSKLLLIDDDQDVIIQYKEALSGSGHELTVANSAAQARTVLENMTPDLAVVDIMMDNGIPGFDLAREIHRKAPAAPILMVSSLNSELKSPMDTAPDVNIPITKFLDKPVSGKMLREEIARALQADPAREK